MHIGVLPKIRQALSGDLSLFGGPATDEALAGRLRTEQFSTILRQTPRLMVANACNAAVFVAACWTSPDLPLAMVWACFVIGLAAILYAKRLMRPPRAKPPSTSERAIRRTVINAGLLGSLWAAVPVLFFNDASSGLQIVITCLAVGMLSGGAFALASIPVAALAFTAPIFIGQQSPSRRVASRSTFWSLY